MITIGGEQELPKSTYFKTLTSSGRDSLKLIIESGHLQDRVFLLPDFLCGVVLDTLNEYSIQYRHYTVQRDLSFELGPIYEGEVVYLVNYFGKQQQDSLDYINNHTVIIDDVFSPFPCVLSNPSWYSFNSLRKISPLADGSLVYSSHPLSEQRIQLQSSSDFTTQKYLAKNKKYEFIHYGHGKEEDYLTLFLKAEKILDNCQSIGGMSIASQIAFAEFCVKLDDERQIRRQNYNMVCELLPKMVIPIETDFYSFAPLLLANRDTIKRQLMDHRIFLPVHWPCNSSLSQQILSIPLDSRYLVDDMKFVCNLIEQLCT
jgi:hypothetical protein